MYSKWVASADVYILQHWRFLSRCSFGFSS